MELEIYLKYKAFTRAEILRKDDRELSSDDKLCYDLEFWSSYLSHKFVDISTQL